MRPKFACSECGFDLHWGDKFCTSCGKPVEWPDARGEKETPASDLPTPRCQLCGAENSPDEEFCGACGVRLSGKKPLRKKDAKIREAQRGSKQRRSLDRHMGSWKLAAGIIVVVVGGVIAFELMTGPKREIAESEHDHSEHSPAANMQALPQIEEMERQVAANPNNQQNLLQLANFLHDNRFYDKAIANYKLYLERNPRDVDARVDLGICFNDLGHFDEARRHMEEALKFDPKHVLAHFNLGIVNLRAGDVDKANEWLEKTVELAPNSGPGQRAKQLLTPHVNMENPATN